MKYECPYCDGTMEDIGDDILRCPKCEYENSKEVFDSALLLSIVEDCHLAFKKFDLSSGKFSSLPLRIELALKIVKG